MSGAGLKEDSFAGEQPYLPIESAGKAAQFFSRGQNPVTGDQDGNRIGAARSPDCPRTTGPAHRGSQRAVTLRLPEGNLPHRLPHLALKIGAGPEVERWKPIKSFPCHCADQSSAGHFMPLSNLRRQARNCSESSPSPRKINLSQTPLGVGRGKFSVACLHGSAPPGTHPAHRFKTRK